MSTNDDKLQKLEKAAKRFLKILEKLAVNEYDTETEKYEVTCTPRSTFRPFLLRLGIRYWHLCPDGGIYFMVNGKKRYGYLGNVFTLSGVRAVKKHLEQSFTVWKMREGANGVCKYDGRTKGVKMTLNGLLCQYCRATDSSHINGLRNMGYTPLHNGKPLGNYLVE